MDNSLNKIILRLRRRVRLLMVERYALFGGSIGMVVCAILVLFAGRMTALLDYRLWIGSVAVGLLAGCAYGLLRRLDDLSVAIAADRRTGMKERLSTAVSLPNADSLADMEQAVLSDASHHFEELKGSEVFRHRFGRPHIAAGISMALLLGVLFIPQLPCFQPKERKQEIAVMKAEGAKIVKIAKEIRKTLPRDKELAQLTAKMEKLGQQMNSGRMPKKQAMLKTRQLTNDIKEAQDKLAAANSGKTMEQARSQAQEASRELAKSAAAKMAADKNIPLEEVMKQLPTDKRLAELARKQTPLTASEMKELEKLIAKYADPSGSLPIPPELSEALAKLMENADYKKAAELMQQLAKKLNSGQMNQIDQEMLKKQMEALAKALQNTDLDKLAKQMRESAEKLAQMSPEELQKLLDEIKKAQMLAEAGGG